MLPNLGDVIANKYRIEARLGEGGFGCVFRGVDELSGRKVAIKVMKVGGTGFDVTRVHRFLRELRAIAKLQSPQTLTLFDYGRTEAGLPFMVTEYIHGEDLNELLVRHGTLTERETAHVVMQILRSLEEAHQMGIVHRDIKPSNIRLFEYEDDRLKAKLLDFGLAHSIRANEARLTGTGRVIGTPRYMSPEQLRGHELTAATDIYSLGLVALECVLGRSATGSDHPRVIADGSVSQTMRDLLSTMLASSAEERATASQMFEAWRAARPGLKGEVGEARVVDTIREIPAPTMPAAKTRRDRLKRHPRFPAKKTPTPAPEPTESPPHVPARLVALLLLVVAAAAAGAVAVLAQLDAEPEPPPRPRPVVPIDGARELIHSGYALERGIEAYDNEEWKKALEEFHRVEQYPDSPDAERLRKGHYVHSAYMKLLRVDHRRAGEILYRHPSQARFFFEEEGAHLAERVRRESRKLAADRARFRQPTFLSGSKARPMSEVGDRLRTNPEFGACDGGDRQGLVVEFTVLGTGIVENVRPTVASRAESPDFQCVVATLEKMRFSHVEPETQRSTYRVTIYPPIVARLITR